MTSTLTHLIAAERALRWPLRLTRAGILSERALRAFWPAATLAMFAAAALMLGLQDVLPSAVVWTGLGAFAVGLAWHLWRGSRAFHRPTDREVLDRLDATLPGRPIAALTDQQAVGAGDAASEAIWAAHVMRMADRVRDARAVPPAPRLAARDPYALRYAALLALVVATMFGSVLRVASVGAAAGGTSTLASGPAWEGWIEPPAYTGRPTLYLNDIDREDVDVPQGSRVTLRLYGEVGRIAVTESLSGNAPPPADATVVDLTVVQDGTLAISGPGGREWAFRMTPDAPPAVRLTGPLEPALAGEFRQPFAAEDDYGVSGGTATVTLDLAEVPRRHGRTIDPEPRDPVILDLPMNLSGDRAAFDEILIDELARHPFAGHPVTLSLTVTDEAGQQGSSAPSAVILPSRRFFDPLAAAIAEQRGDLLWNRDNGPRIAQVLRAITYAPDGLFRSDIAYLKLRFVIRRLEAAATQGAYADAFVDETEQALWDIALLIEEGDLSDALERLRRAQERLAEAIENGATDAEIAELMQELREAMQDYMRQLAQQQDPSDQPQMSENAQPMDQNQLEQMLQELQDLMEQGRMAEAQRLLEQLRQMMENMQVAQGQQGQQGGPGQQAMEGLAETLRNQQGLSDEAFRDLQEQFGQPGQEGQQGQQGQGQPGQGQQGQGRQGQPGGSGGSGGDQDGADPGTSLADRQQALRDELSRQQQSLPGAGTPGGDAARDALGRAGRAMDDAEQALRDENFADALDSQSEAIEALREGMRELGEEMARQQGQPGQPGEGEGMAQGDSGRRDPLGRESGDGSALGTESDLLGAEDVYRRARELLDEIRRRSGDQSRPDAELDYLRRLLDRF